MVICRWKRIQFAILCTLSNIACYADRTNIGVVVLHLDLSHQEAGYVLAAFFYGYLCTQLPGGFWASRYGGKPVLLGGVLVWTVCDVLTIPAAADGALPLLLTARIGMGLGEGVNFPCLHHMSSAWFPASERSRSVGLINSGGDMGTMLSLLVAPQIAEHLGWEYVFVVFGSLSTLWMILFYCVGAGAPEFHHSISDEERDFIVRTRRSFDAIPTQGQNSDTGNSSADGQDSDGRMLLTSPTTLRPTDSITRLDELELETLGFGDESESEVQQYAEKVDNVYAQTDDQKQTLHKTQEVHAAQEIRSVKETWQSIWELLRERPVRALIVSHTCFNYGWYVLLSWLPRYMKEKQNMDLTKGGAAHLLAPYFCGLCGTLGAGWISDKLIARGWAVGTTRKTINSIGMFGPASFLFILGLLDHPSEGGATVLLAAAMGTSRFVAAGFWANMIDLTTDAGLLMAVSNTIATVPGILGNALTGWILTSTGSWSLVFWVAALVYFIGGVAFALGASGQELRRPL